MSVIGGVFKTIKTGVHAVGDPEWAAITASEKMGRAISKIPVIGTANPDVTGFGKIAGDFVERKLDRWPLNTTPWGENTGSGRRR